jgi:hypothetical protein
MSRACHHAHTPSERILSARVWRQGIPGTYLPALEFVSHAVRALLAYEHTSAAGAVHIDAFFPNDSLFCSYYFVRQN